MKKLKQRPSKNTGIATMRFKYIITAIVLACAAIAGALVMMGPKMSLQIPPAIEQKAMSYLNKNKLLNNGEQVTGYKAISYYNYDQAAVLTNQRIFLYNNKKVFSILLDKITKVSIRDSELGHQRVLITASDAGAIVIELYHTEVPKLIQLLKVPSANVTQEHVTVDKTKLKTGAGKV